MRTKSTMNMTATVRHLVAGFALSSITFAFLNEAQAQEIPLTGPLAGAPAVRKLRLYREGRFEVTPNVSFSLLDEYKRTIMAGATLAYNVSDWLSLGVWGAYGVAQMDTDLTNQISDQNNARRAADPTAETLDRRLTQVNLGPNFKKQLGTIEWIAAPQITVTPFRGKLALFQSLYIDTDLHFFAGPAFVGLKERKECKVTGTCTTDASFDRSSRTTIAPTFGLGLSFFTNSWGAITFDWRAVPFSRNTAGFDTAGSGADKAFPDNRITSDDQHFRFNQMLTVGYSIFLPFEHRNSL